MKLISILLILVAFFLGVRIFSTYLFQKWICIKLLLTKKKNRDLSSNGQISPNKPEIRAQALIFYTIILTQFSKIVK